MRNIALAAVVLSSFIGSSIVISDTAQAASTEEESKRILAVVIERQPDTELIKTKPPTEPVVEAPIEKVAPQTHTVVAGDNLSKIGTAYQTTWQRLFDKNPEIANPDVLNVGQVITIPSADEILVSRPLPVPEPVVAVEPRPQAREARNNSPAPRSSSSASTNRAPASSAGNRYTAGYCTWYVKNMRPDLPNNLGNANTWASRAAAQGMATGSQPRVGAVGQQGMHVVYVQSVNGDGTVTISEMNYTGLYNISTRTVPASSFTYIY